MLKTWITGTKDFTDQGLSPSDWINDNVTIVDGGKLGKCMYFNGTSSRLSTTGYTLGNKWSWACWVKEDPSVTAWQGIIALNNNGSDSDMQTALWLKANEHRFEVCNNTNYNSTIQYTQGQWNHYAMSFDGTTTKAYLNGNQVATFTSSSILSKTNLTIGARGSNTNGGHASATNFLKGYINDLRIWDDEVISPLQVKQISQGLVLHYPLDNNGFGGENILVNTSFQSQYVQSTGWDTTKNGTQLANSWGGYNSGVTNASTVYHAHLKEIDGEWVYEYIRTANESWLGISQGGLNSKLTAGKTYTFSWEEYRVEGNNYSSGGLYYYKTGATSAGFHLGQFGGSSGNILGQWRKFSYTFTAPTDGDYSKSMIWYIYGVSGGNGKMYIRHPKLEEGTKPTPWCPNENDALYSSMGMNDNIEYDTSGFGNNGTRVGDFSWSTDTPRYLVSTQFQGAQYIIGESPSSEGATISLWVKTASTSNAAVMIDYKSKLGFGFYSGVIIPSCNSTIRTTYSTTNYIANQWNHIAVVRDSNSTLQLYINGILQTNINEKQDYWSGGVIDGLSIAARPNGSNPVSCAVSDVRIYATALSASDVLSLYQNSAYIDSSGNVYGAVHTEV